MKNLTLSLLFLSILFSAPLQVLAADDANQIVKAAIDYWRGETSRSSSTMMVHRPDWERSMSMVVVTKGSDLSLVRFTEPKRDAGNASLVVGNEMWSFSPKINRVIKIPSSMKTQSWMGSDFSYSDLSKADDIIDEYDHQILRKETHEGKDVTVVQSTPKENAPIAWGKEILFIRSDKIIIRHEFYDQEMKLVKFMQALEIKPLGGKLFATQMRMTEAEKEDSWTQMQHNSAEFGLEVSDETFTQSNLRSASR